MHQSRLSSGLATSRAGLAARVAIFAAFLAAGCAAAVAAQGAAPSVLISIQGTENVCCFLNDNREFVGEYDMQVFTDGTTQGAIFWRVTTDLPSDPPTSAFLFRGALTPTDFRNLQARIVAAKLGVQRDCQAALPFLNNGRDAHQRLFWFGPVAAKENDFVLFRGAPCPHDLRAVLHILSAHIPGAEPSIPGN